MSVLTTLPLAKPLVCLLRPKLHLCCFQADHQFTTLPTSFSPSSAPISLSLPIYLLRSHYQYTPIALITSAPPPLSRSFTSFTFTRLDTSSTNMDFPHSQQLSMGNSTLPSGFSHVSLEPYKPSTSKLYKAFLNDPMLSDVTIRLGDRSLYAHRIVLCRGSEYFARMLTGRFQVSHMPPSTSHKISELT